MVPFGLASETRAEATSTGKGARQKRGGGLVVGREPDPAHSGHGGVGGPNIETSLGGAINLVQILILS